MFEALQKKTHESKTIQKKYAKKHNSPAVPAFTKMGFIERSDSYFDDVRKHYNLKAPAQLKANQGIVQRCGMDIEKSDADTDVEESHKRPKRSKPYNPYGEDYFYDTYKDSIEEYDDKDLTYDPHSGYRFNQGALEDNANYQNNIFAGSLHRINMQGNRTADKAEYKKIYAHEPAGYAFHHHKDFDKSNLTCSMELVKIRYHQSHPHMGACSQYGAFARQQGSPKFKYK